MARFVVDGLTLPIAIGGHPAVDLCNTITDRGGPAPYEYFPSFAHVAVWSREVGLVSPRSAAAAIDAATDRPGDAAAVLDRLVRFREAVHRGLVDSVRSDDWATIDREIGASTTALHLEAAPTGPAIGAWAVRATDPVVVPLAAAVWSAAGLLATVRPGDVRACPGAGCGWLFLDPAHRRRWCSMAWCGNRAKARRHAQRQRRAIPS